MLDSGTQGKASPGSRDFDAAQKEQNRLQCQDLEDKALHLAAELRHTSLSGQRQRQLLQVCMLSQNQYRTIDGHLERSHRPAEAFQLCRQTEPRHCTCDSLN